MIVNIILNGYLVNANLGDSRTILGVKNEDDWDLAFSSVDHNTINPEKVLDIRGNGGYFVNRKGELLGVLPGLQNYFHLSNARVYRPPTVSSLSMALSHKRTLNLTGTLGDIHFKLEPPVLSAKPDVKFTPLHPSKEYILIACTDGIWDYLKSNMDQNVQNEMVLDYVTRILENKEISRSFALPTPDSPDYKSIMNEAPKISDKITLAASSVVKRQNSDIFPEIFYENAQRYDDATCQLVHIKPRF